jgi:hypothetical protein
MNKSKFLFLVFILFFKTATGQSLLSPGEGFQVSFSTGNIQYKDHLYNGLRNSGLNISIGFNYSLNKEKFNHEAGFNLDAAILWNRYGWDNYCFQPNMHYRLLVKVGDRLQLGGNFGYSSYYLLNEYFDSHHTYWLTTFALGLSACYTIPLNSRWNLIIPINVPLVGFLSRPDADRNLILNEPDLKFSDVLKRINSNFHFVNMCNNYFEIETGLSLRTRLKSNRQITFGYKVHYELTSTSLKSELLTNQLIIQYPLNKK